MVFLWLLFGHLLQVSFPYLMSNNRPCVWDRPAKYKILARNLTSKIVNCQEVLPYPVVEIVIIDIALLNFLDSLMLIQK